MRNSCLAVSKNLIHLFRKMLVSKENFKRNSRILCFLVFALQIENLLAGCKKPEKTRMLVLHYLVRGIMLPIFFSLCYEKPRDFVVQNHRTERLLRGLCNITFAKPHCLGVICFSDDFSEKGRPPLEGLP